MSTFPRILAVLAIALSLVGGFSVTPRHVAAAVPTTTAESQASMGVLLAFLCSVIACRLAQSLRGSRRAGLSPSSPARLALASSTLGVQVVPAKRVALEAVSLAGLLGKDVPRTSHDVLHHRERPEVRWRHAAFRAAFALVVDGRTGWDVANKQGVNESVSVSGYSPIRSSFVELAIARAVRRAGPRPARPGGIYFG